MRLLRLLLPLAGLVSVVLAQEQDQAPKETHSYQSDVARLRKIVINSLYSHKEIFLRELISNANDALEKLRLSALHDKTIWSGEPLNITIEAVKSKEDPTQARLIITDTGIGMSPEELKNNLGTLARSGTTEFLSKAEGQDATGQGNLIGAFGLGFYSSFLVADRVEVASIPPKTEKNPDPVQTIFRSSADDSSFEIFPDPRGNTLGRGTEIILFMKEDSQEYLDEVKIKDLVAKHSEYSSSFPIYLHVQRYDQVPVEDEEDSVQDGEPTPESVAQAAEGENTGAESDGIETPKDESEAKIEEILETELDNGEPISKYIHAQWKNILVDEFIHLNANPPLWQRDPKNITDAEYIEFYKPFFKEYEDPTAWDHFSGDSGSGVSFKSIVFLPSKIPNLFWQQPLNFESTGVKLLVKRTFITSDFGEDSLPKWAGWVKALIDADDLPLNVSRETLQSNRFLRQMKNIILKHLISIFTRLSDPSHEKHKDFYVKFGTALKLGAVEDVKHREKLAGLARFQTNQREMVTLDQYVENRKQGQKQIFYLSEMGKTFEDLHKSVFLEKLHARGYEVLLLNEPLDELFVGNIKKWKNIKFQDIAKAGLKFGDEDSDEKEAEELKDFTEEYEPLLKFLKQEAKDAVRNVIVSSRLVTSPCAVIADSGGYTANMQRMLRATNSRKEEDAMHQMAIKAKTLEVNPRSPLIQGMLKRVKQLEGDDEGNREELEDELKEVAVILIDGAMVRSGFEVSNTDDFFGRVDRVLRRSLGVSETAKTEAVFKPAPPVDPEEPPEEEEEPEQIPLEPLVGEQKPHIQLPDNLKDKVSIELEELDDDDPMAADALHDEL